MLILISKINANSGEFTLYDHVLDHCSMFNAIPERYTKSGLSDVDISFGEWGWRRCGSKLVMDELTVLFLLVFVFSLFYFTLLFLLPVYPF